MQWTSALAIYGLFWVLSLFIMLPIGIKTSEEMGQEKIPGQADGAPGNFKPLTVLLRTSLFAAVLFGLFYANYIHGWVGLEDIDIISKLYGR